MAEASINDLTPTRRLDKQFWKLFKKGTGQDVYGKEVYEAIVKASTSKENITRIEEMTRGQSKNPNWFKLRNGLVTASKFKEVLDDMKTMHEQPFDTEYQMGEIGDKLIDYEGKEVKPPNEAMKWGNKHEAVALQHYESIMNTKCPGMNLRRPGLFIYDKHPMIGASPDGIVSYIDPQGRRSEWLVEVKCPYNARDDDPKVAAQKRGMHGEALVMDDKHMWYPQVQAQMGILGMRRCDLVVYTKKGIAFSTVQFDKPFFDNMMDTIEEFISESFYTTVLDLE